MLQQIEYNIVIANKYFKNNIDLLPLLFDNEQYALLDPFHLKDNRPIDMYDILVYCHFFQSKSDARKNWKKTEQKIPDGFTDIQKIGKAKRRLTIWNPIGYEE